MWRSFLSCEHLHPLVRAGDARIAIHRKLLGVTLEHTTEPPRSALFLVRQSVNEVAPVNCGPSAAFHEVMKIMILLVFAFADVALTLILATEHHPLQYLSLHRSNNSTSSWFSQHFYLGASTFDLALLSLLRFAICMVSCVRACTRRATPRPRAPLVEPLNATIERSDDANAAAEAPVAEDTAAPVKRTSAVVALVASVATHRHAPSGVVLAYCFTKAVARLFQSGLPKLGTGALPVGNTAPVEAYFWGTLTVAPVLAECERRLANGGSAAKAEDEKERRKREDNDLGLETPDDDDDDEDHEDAKDPAAEVKRDYLRRTTPKASNVLRLAWRIFKPDLPILLFGYRRRWHEPPP